MKKLFSFFMALFCIAVFSVTTFAKDLPHVYSDSISVSDDELIVSVKIENNPGLMGFKLNFTYDDKVLKPIEADSGLIVKCGTYNDSIETSKNSTFSVVWSSTEDVSVDGELVELHFKVLDTDASQTVIEMECSKADTFNSAWEDVSLDCDDISVKLNYDLTTTTTDVNVDEALKKAIQVGLKNADASSVSDISEGNKEAFADTVKDEMKKSTAEYDNMTTDEIIELAQKLDKGVENTNTTKAQKSEVVTTEKNNNTKFFVLIGVVITVAAVIILNFIIRRKKHE